MPHLHAHRVEAAQKQYELVKSQYQAGILRSEDLFRAQKLLLEASYEAATTPEARLQALKSSVELAAADYKHVTARVEYGAGSQLDRIGALYSALTAEIRLVQEEERQATGKPSR